MQAGRRCHNQWQDEIVRHFAAPVRYNAGKEAVVERLELTEVADNDPAGYARWFGALWGLCAIVVLAIAAYKTAQLTTPFVPQPLPGRVGVLGTFGPAHPPTATVRYEESGALTSWVIQYPAGTRFVLLPASSGIQCRQESTAAQDFAVPVTDGPGGSERVNVVAANANTGLTWQTPPVYAAGYFRCHLPRPLEVRDSFAGSELPFYASFDPEQRVSQEQETIGDAMANSSISEEGRGLHAARLLVSAAVDRAQNMQVYGGLEQSVSATVLLPGENATFKYDDVDLLNKRDAQFVLVGALIALGAAMALEALRPFVEWLAASMHRSSKRT